MRDLTRREKRSRSRSSRSRSRSSSSRSRSSSYYSKRRSIKRNGDDRENRRGSRSNSRYHESERNINHERRIRSRSRSIDSEEGLTQAQLEEKRELERLTRDARTVFISQLQIKCTEKDIKYFFEHALTLDGATAGTSAGAIKVKDVVLIKDKFTGRSKGYGYVELRTLEDVPKALMLNNSAFLFSSGKRGFPVLVKPSEAEKNFTHFMEKKSNVGTATFSATSSILATKERSLMQQFPVLREPWHDKLEIKNLNPEIEEHHVKMLCEPFGSVLGVDLITDFSGRSTGQCFVHFRNSEDSREALRELDGVKVVEFRLKVFKMQKGQISRLVGTTQRDINKLIGRTETVSEIDEVNMNVSWKLEADGMSEGRYGGGGVAMNASQKMSLMTKLAGGAGSELLEETKQKLIQGQFEVMAAEEIEFKLEAEKDAAKINIIKGLASKYLLLKKVFDEKEETEEDWEQIIEEDIVFEAQRFGQVSHVFVDKSAGNVYLAMATTQSGVDCAKALHGRWFGKRRVEVEYLTQTYYESRFPT